MAHRRVKPISVLMPPEYSDVRIRWDYWLLEHPNFDYALEVCQRVNPGWPMCWMLYDADGIAALRHAHWRHMRGMIHFDHLRRVDYIAPHVLAAREK